MLVLLISRTGSALSHVNERLFCSDTVKEAINKFSSLEEGSSMALCDGQELQLPLLFVEPLSTKVMFKNDKRSETEQRRPIRTRNRH